MNTEPTKPAQEEEEDSRVRQIVDLGSSVVTNDHGTVHCLTIIGQIEGHGQAPSGTKTTKYEHVLPLLASIEESQEVDGLLVLLHTMGGDVEAGLAIAEMIAGMTKPTVTLVLGGGHSIGIPLAVAGKVTLMAPSASMTIHPIRMSGLMIAAPQTYHYFERLQDRITRFVAAHSHITEERFRQLMLSSGDMANDVGSIVYGEEAVAAFCCVFVCAYFFSPCRTAWAQMAAKVSSLMSCSILQASSSATLGSTPRVMRKRVRVWCRSSILAAMAMPESVRVMNPSRSMVI